MSGKPAYWQCRREGLCVGCGLRRRVPAKAGRVMCQICEWKSQANHQRAYARRRRRGLCNVCPAPARPGRTTCKAHGGDLHRRKTCGHCGEPGHNVRGCPALKGGPAAPMVTDEKTEARAGGQRASGQKAVRSGDGTDRFSTEGDAC